MAIHEKSDYYAAATIRAIFASQGAKVSQISEYLLEFSSSVSKATTSESDESDSRSVWLGALGISQE
jgi:hypothetical protein